MKNFTQVFALLVLLTFTSCTIDDDNYDVINEQEKSIATNSYKTATITYESGINNIALDGVKQELKVRKIVKLTNNQEAWVMNTSESTRYLEDFLLFTDGVLDVEVVEGNSILNEEGKDGDSTGNGDTDSVEERDGNSTGNGDTDSVEERDGDSTGNGDTDSVEERDGDSTGNGDTDSVEERNGDSTGNGDTDSVEERGGDSTGNGDTDSAEERNGDSTGNGDTDSVEERGGDSTGNGDTDSEEE